jgi:DNA-binding XRE family transcriptional regulator
VRSTTDDHAVQIHKNSHPVNITFSVSKYPSDTLGELLKKLRLEKGLELKQLAKRLRVHRNTVYEWENEMIGRDHLRRN